VIEKVDGSTLTLKLVKGGDARLTLAGGARIVAVVKASMADIKENTFLGSAAMPQPDGTLRALEVYVFPESARGTGEGHYPWDVEPGSTMTNATIAQVVTTGDGRVLTLRYRDGEKRLLVPESAPIVTSAPADRSALVPGAHVFIYGALREPDGAYAASRVTVGLNGLVPPM
jgi:hypothetical protein